jgi:hypothetical protein
MYKKDIKISEIAELCHEVNRAYCQCMGDSSQLPWAEAPQWARDSAINGVSYHLDNPDSTPEDSHNSWLREKEKEGWCYGLTKNPSSKTHPCFVQYALLPIQQRAKDYIFTAIVKTIAKNLNA